jgi:mRNA-degrading endonuclease RelE of RelBE toxin-antitoxin system
MNIDYKPSFRRSIEKVVDKRLKTMVAVAIASVKIAQSPKDIPKLKKMKGNKAAYRIKVSGKYRICVNIEGGLVTFVDFGHRKNIYK